METATDDRVLQFFPASTARQPMSLSPDQVAAYNRDGIVPRVRLIPGDEMKIHRAAFDRLLAAHQARGMDHYSLNSCQATCASVYDLATDPRITAPVADLLGDAFACWSTHYFCKLPGCEKQVSWHQDAPYWPFSAARTVTVWLAIDDVDVGNGAMHVIPGSHLAGALPMRRTAPEEKNVLWLTVDREHRQGRDLPVVLDAGEASLHSDMILHGSAPNPSPRRRCGLALRYCTLDVRACDGWNRRSIIIRGSDPTGHWGHVARRPDGDRPFTDGPLIGAN
jgi:non-heme Fe2+,alpha-ketoglutarate-dependent halogenase